MKDKTGKQLTFKEIILKIFRRLNAMDLEFEMMVLRFVGFLPSHHIRRFFYRLGGMKIGKGSTLHTGATFYDTRNISLGSDTIVGENAVLDGRAKISIGNHVDIEIFARPSSTAFSPTMVSLPREILRVS